MLVVPACRWPPNQPQCRKYSSRFRYISSRCYQTLQMKQKKTLLIMIDGSLAMWNAALKSFTSETRILYYHRCSRIVTGEAEKSNLKSTESDTLAEHKKVSESDNDHDNVYYNPIFCHKLQRVVLSRICCTLQMLSGDLSRHVNNEKGFTIPIQQLLKYNSIQMSRQF